MTTSAINYVPPPTEFAVLVVHREARRLRGAWTWSTPQADHLIQSNSERRRYPAHGRPPLMFVPAPIRAAVATWSRRHVE